MLRTGAGFAFFGGGEAGSVVDCLASSWLLGFDSLVATQQVAASIARPSGWVRLHYSDWL